MADPSRLRKSLQRWLGRMEPADPVYLAQYVEESTINPGYHVVDVLRPDGTVGERREARGRCKAWAGVVVRLSVNRKKYGPEELVIIGADEGGYGTAAAPSMLEIHGPDHGFLQPDEIPNLHTLQIYPDRCQPKAGLVVRVLPGLYFADHSYQRLAAAVDEDLTASVPGVPGKRYVTLSLDAAGGITVTNGTIKAALAPSDIPLVPTGECPIAVVWLEQGDAEIPRTRIDDLRYLVGGAASGGGSGSGLWENVIIVAKAGGDYTTIQAGEDAAGVGQLALVMPGAYAENVTVDTANLTLAGLIPSQRRGPWGAYLTGADDVGPILDLDSQCVVANMVINRELTGGAGAYIGVDASAAANSQLIDCRVDIGGGATGRDVTAVKIAAAAGSEVAISRCFIRADSYGAGAAVEICGADRVILEYCTIIGDLKATAGVEVYLHACVVDGDVTGVAGADLLLKPGCHITGTIAGWDSVTEHDHSGVGDGGTVAHSDTGGLQGGAAGEYYHLTAAQHTAVGLMVTAGLDALTTAEVDQLENIGATTITAAQWGYLGAMNQGVATGDSPTFANVYVPDGGYVGTVAGNGWTYDDVRSAISTITADVAIGTIAPERALHVKTAAYDDGATIESTHAGSSHGPRLRLWRCSGSPAVNDLIGLIEFDGEDNVGARAPYAAIGAKIIDPTNTIEKGELHFHTASGALTHQMTLSYQGHLVPIAASGQDLGDATHRWDLFATAADVAGNLVVGTGAATYRSNVYETSTAIAGNIIGDYVLATMNPSGASAASLYGNYIQARMAGGNNNNCTGTIVMYRGTADWYGSGTLTSLYGFWPSVVNRNTGTVSSAVGVFGFVANFSTGTMTSAYGLRSEITNTGGGTITTGIGLYISAVHATTAYGCYIGTVSGTTEYGIYQSDASNKNFFAGKVGIGAVPAVSALLELSSTVGALLLTRMTTAQRNALTAVNGMVIYNTTTGTVEAREGGAWVNL